VCKTNGKTHLMNHKFCAVGKSASSELLTNMKRTNAPKASAKRTKFAKARNSFLKSTTRPKAYLPLPRSITPYGGSAFPAEMRATLRYVDWDLTLPISTPGNPYVFQYWANSVYDPNYTSTGHQPQGFDNLMAIYNHFRVVKSKITITMNVVDAGVFSMVLYLDDDASTASSITNAQEQAGSKFVSFTKDSGPRHLSLNYDAETVWGPAYMNEDKLVGTASSNPSEGQYFTMIVNNVGTFVGVSVYVNVKIDYDVIFDERKTMPVN